MSEDKKQSAVEMTEMRYLRWREAARAKKWPLDRHWYVLVGLLYEIGS